MVLSAYLLSRSSTMPRDKSFAWKEFILDKFRASMKAERSSKAVYLDMNQRALRRAIKQCQGIYKISDDEALRLEEEVLAMVESKQESEVEEAPSSLLPSGARPREFGGMKPF